MHILCLVNISRILLSSKNFELNNFFKWRSKLNFSKDFERTVYFFRTWCYNEFIYISLEEESSLLSCISHVKTLLRWPCFLVCCQSHFSLDEYMSWILLSGIIFLDRQTEVWDLCQSFPSLDASFPFLWMYGACLDGLPIEWIGYYSKYELSYEYEL